MKIKQAEYILLAGWIGSLLFISSLLGFLFKNDIMGWYESLQISPFTPPSIVFSIVWPILYSMIATVGWIIWNQKTINHHNAIKIVYITQLLLNWSWMPLFFKMHLIGSSLICLITTLLLSLSLVFLLKKQLPVAALLLVPYTAWLTFAAYLNMYVLIHN